MKLIPVIDYKQGHVVHAKAGMRDNYQPIDSLLCKSSNIFDVIDDILTLADFKTIYAADLDCIENQQLDFDLWAGLFKHYPSIEFWLDIGILCNQWPEFLHNSPNARPVLGSESFESSKQLTSSLNLLGNLNPLISIDIKADKILGPDDLLTTIQHHSYEVIIISISNVGTSHGPNKSAVSEIMKSVSNKNIYYGGGIRHINDINQLNNTNISGILVANALHSGCISQQELVKFISQQP